MSLLRQRVVYETKWRYNRRQGLQCPAQSLSKDGQKLELESNFDICAAVAEDSPPERMSDEGRALLKVIRQEVFVPGDHFIPSVILYF